MVNTERPVRTIGVFSVLVGVLVLLSVAAAVTTWDDRATSDAVTAVTTGLPQPDAATGDAAESRYQGSTGASMAVRYWSGFALSAAIEIEHYDSLSQMVNSSTAVVLVRAIGPGPHWSGQGDPANPSDKTGVSSLRVEVVEVLAGQLDFIDGSVVAVTGLNVPSGVATDDPAILFLRSHQERLMPPATFADPRAQEGYDRHLADFMAFAWDKYRLVSTQGVLVGVDGGTANPARDWLDPVAGEVRSMTMEEVAARIRAVAGHPELAKPLDAHVCCEPSK